MSAEISPELLKKCTENMDLFEVPVDFRQFCRDALHLEHEMSSEPGNIRRGFSSSKSDANKEALSHHLEEFSASLQSTFLKFKDWTMKLKSLTSTSKHLPSLKVMRAQVKQLKAPYYIKTGEMAIQEGELIEITEWTEDACIKVKVNPNREGTIPILSLIIPSSDFNLNALVERLHLVVLCSWFDCFRIFYRRLFTLLLVLLDVLSYTYPSNVAASATGPRTSKDLHVLKKLVSRLEDDHLGKDGSGTRVEGTTTIGEAKDAVAKMSKAYRSYKVFEKLLKNFKVPDEADKFRPLCIFDKLSEFQSRVPKDKPIKYYKTKIVIESIETQEEIFHYPATDSSSSVSEGSTPQTKVESERLTSSSQEVQKRFVVKSVRDPKTGKDISLDDAIKEGIVDMSRGLYINPVLGVTVPIPTAMNEGTIKVEAITESATKPKMEEMGVITVKSPVVEHREYRVVQTIDPITAEKLNPEAARKRGWLVDQGYTVDSRLLSMEEAIDIGWVQVEYLTPLSGSERKEEEEEKYEARTYLIRSVGDEGVGFAEAVTRGLIDTEHGCYVDPTSREKISLDDALKRGLVKGRRVRKGEDPGQFMVSPDNRVVAGNLKKFKAVVGALTAFGVKGKKGSPAAVQSEDSPH